MKLIIRCSVCDILFCDSHVKNSPFLMQYIYVCECYEAPDPGRSVLQPGW